MNRIIAASNNQHKIDEIQRITSKFGLDVVGYSQAGLETIEIEEDGTTFEENSLKKAMEIYSRCQSMTIADDSGLMVDFLGGEPGIYSARYAGEPSDDARNNEKLLTMLDGVSYSNRRAKFVSVITLVVNEDKVIVARGECHGHIITEKRGDQGFGYDPLFIPDGFQNTFAQLGQEQKNSISHRAKALQILEQKLKEEGFELL